MAHANGRIPTTAMSPIPAGFHTHGTTAYLRADAADAFLRVAHAFEKRFGKRLVAMSFYRPLSDQIRIFLKNYYRHDGARRAGTTDRSFRGATYRKRSGMSPVASPGYSNHGMGTTVDFNSGVQTSGSNEHGWMQSVATQHGWDWTAGRRVGEPWHWEYMPSRDRKRGAPKAPSNSSGGPSTTVADLVVTQATLMTLGYEPGPVDGKLGTTTTTAVKAFQRDAGVKADGIPGPTTRTHLEAAMSTLSDIKKIVTQNQADIRAARTEAKRAADVATVNQREIRAAKAEAARAADVATVNQGDIRLTRDRVGPIRRVDGEYSIRQEIADAKTLAISAEARDQAILRAVQDAAQHGTPVDLDDVTAAAEAGVASAIKSISADVTLTVTEG